LLNPTKLSHTISVSMLLLSSRFSCNIHLSNITHIIIKIFSTSFSFIFLFHFTSLQNSCVLTYTNQYSHQTILFFLSLLFPYYLKVTLFKVLYFSSAFIKLSIFRYPYFKPIVFYKTKVSFSINKSSWRNGYLIRFNSLFLKCF